MQTRLLVVDDEPHILESLRVFFAREGFDVDAVPDGESGLDRLPGSPRYDVALVDLNLPDLGELGGIDFIRKAKEMTPSLPCIIMTAFGSIPSAIEATRAGAFHYVTKPFKLDDVKVIVERAIQFGRLQEENDELKAQLKSKYRFENIVGNSEPMCDVYRIIERVARTDSTVLILGESGTGKELVAKAIHYNSPRRHRPLVAVNCGAIPENLLESELFGHLRGSFTGAIANKQGRFSAADGGTIFLDEIGEMSANLQVKLLRVLEEHAFEPVGGVKPIKVDVRVIAATNVNMEEAVRSRTVREDLYYRLNVIRIDLPPLRERRDDIPLLLQHFVERFHRVPGPVPTLEQFFAPDALDTLFGYHWPGNVRELQNLIERLTILKGDGRISRADMPERVLQGGPVRRESWSPAADIPADGISLKDEVNAFEDRLIKRALEMAHGNKNRAAELLRMNRTTLIEKMKRKRLGPLNRRGDSDTGLGDPGEPLL